VTLDLTINNSNTGTDVIEACDSYVWIDGNTNMSSNNTATFTLTNVAGCDSVVTLDLTINNSNTGTDVIEACDSYVWIDGNTYMSSNNTATFTLTNVAGCDSVVTLDLTINNSNTGTDVITACDSYTWIDGNTYMSSNNTAIFTLTNVAGCDSVVTLDLTINNSNTGTDVIEACDSYVWIDGNTYTISNNTATFTLTNASGCDSVVTLDLTINSIDVSLNNTITEITANNPSGTYQWIDCDNQNMEMAGEISQTFSPSQNGNYAVVITENNCVDTSECVLINSLSVEEGLQLSEASIYPNPTNGKVRIELSSSASPEIKIYSVNGTVVKSQNFENSKTFDLNIPGDSGVYFVVIKTKNQVRPFRVIKRF
jgi:NAD-dependent dihydropyrimidine dehydrogenase PreA subunit